MAAKSDFAQKLLHDLRLRKERMAAAENSSRQSSRTSGGRSSRGAQQIHALESTGYRTGNTSRRVSGSSRSININESSSQIVIYESGQSSRQVRDLTMAIAFAFENGGNLTKIGASSSNPLVNFFNRFSRRSMGSQKMDMTNFNVQGLSIDQFPNVSNIHIGEISKGVQKLNQILRACSNGFNFDTNSIEVGKELLKGATDLEESLRMLVNLQESSRYMNGAQTKSRLKLLEEDEDDQDNDKIADQWRLDRPRFSFDKPSRNSYGNKGATRQQQLALPYPQGNSDTGNSKMLTHRRSTSYVQDLSLSTQVKLNSNSSSSQSTQEKGRISNVIAKLMGLEELPQKEGLKGVGNDSKGKAGKQERVSQRNIKLPEHLNREHGKGSPLNTDRKSSLTNNASPAREPKLQLKYEKSRDVPDGNSRIVSSEKNKLQQNLKIPAVGTEVVLDQKIAGLVTNKKQRHTSASNHASGLQSFDNRGRKQNLTKDKESKVIEMESNKSGLNTEMQQMAQKGKTVKAEEKTHNRFEHKINANLMEKKNSNQDVPGNQEQPQDQRVSLQDHVPRRNEHLEDKWQAEQRSQQFQKQNLIAKKQEGHRVETMAASKSKRSTATNLKKLSQDKPTPSNEKLVKPTEKVSMRDPPNRRHQDVAYMIDKSQETASNQENSKKEDKSRDPPPRQSQSDMNVESGNQVLTKEKPTETSTTQMTVVPRKVQKSEIPQKIDMLITRRNASVNNLARSRKQPANILKDLKQQMHSKNRSSRRMNEQRGGRVKEEHELIFTSDASDMNTEPVNQQEQLQIEVDQTSILTSRVADECQIQNRTQQNENYYATDLNSGKVSDEFQSAEESFAHKDGQELKECDQIDEHEEGTELYNLSQHEHNQLPAWARQEQLTEPEKDLKEILIKSQLFLSTAEALFKLNIPVSFLHAGDHDDEVAKKKLVLDSAYEVMKRKARRHEISFHPYLKNSKSYNHVRSLDDLVKQLCKDLEMLKFYGRNGGDECDVAASLYTMLNNDIYDKNPDVNCMWDLEWSKMMFMFPEKDEVVRDIERHMLNGLLDEITNDLLCIKVSV